MTPEDRTHKPLRPTARGTFQKVGMVASLALVMAAAVSPASAAAGSVTDRAAVSCDGQRQLSSHGDEHDKDECRREPGPKGDTGAPGPCSDIDTYSRTDAQGFTDPAFRRGGPQRAPFHESQLV
ncbi:hypothetical protein [Streptomyces sp. NBC_00154]|uniref:hypothetical protein n=1 Tax=Streptomyces sp. NBC_00154 TaxID=2975670 RepID=UPI0022504638|nr:hypothetical protein [Streptomyces sp. NBC_00154]MCX5316903.1 hypothetical protein [Streptomyces sp. NBC_00154]